MEFAAMTWTNSSVCNTNIFSEMNRYYIMQAGGGELCWGWRERSVLRMAFADR